jgi:hypothetical protein
LKKNACLLCCQALGAAQQQLWSRPSGSEHSGPVNAHGPMAGGHANAS